MHATTTEARRRWNARYTDGEQPWDTRQTPPEVIDFWASGRLRPDGRGLDLGCGPGTNVRFLARLGLDVTGIEIAEPALVTAQQRLFAEERHLAPRCHFVCADVCHLPFDGLDAPYILDIGCFHSLPDSVRPLYVDGVIRNLAPGGYYQLYAFDRMDAEQAGGPGGLVADEVKTRFGSHLTLIEEVIAKPERRPCRWFLLQRPA